MCSHTHNDAMGTLNTTRILIIFSIHDFWKEINETEHDRQIRCVFMMLNSHWIFLMPNLANLILTLIHCAELLFLTHIFNIKKVVRI